MQIVIVHMADTLQELNEDTDTIKAAAAGKSCQIGVLTNRQERGLNTALPNGLRYVDALEAVKSGGDRRPDSIYHQRNPGSRWILLWRQFLSGNIITINRASYVNPHAFVIGYNGRRKIHVCENGNRTGDL